MELSVFPCVSSVSRKKAVGPVVPPEVCRETSPGDPEIDPRVRGVLILEPVVEVVTEFQ
jgi:hypothetical protein